MPPSIFNVPNSLESIDYSPSLVENRKAGFSVQTSDRVTVAGLLGSGRLITGATPSDNPRLRGDLDLLKSKRMLFIPFSLHGDPSFHWVPETI